ncbi:hypothetical protein [Chryseobacterium sp. SC28]|uniref:hypothetical protein n=1 Tax=Chryseobacterium sp. SC28 TaxID=2268028 RepID=UPI000F6470C0|nr:hypothetical protein [Chryseobacterium sp. SC28]
MLNKAPLRTLKIFSIRLKKSLRTLRLKIETSTIAEQSALANLKNIFNKIKKIFAHFALKSVKLFISSSYQTILQ